MNLQELIQTPGEWMRGSGPEAEIVISSRVRLARNIRGYHFITRMDEAERAGCEGLVRKQLEEGGIAQPGSYFPLHETDALDRKLFVERHLISKEHEDAAHPRGV